MGTVLVVILIIIVVIVAGGVAFFVALARKGRAKALDNARLAPGVESAAPTEWGGAHTPEAELHRRLRAAARAVESVGVDDPAAIEGRVAIQQQIAQIDKQLVAAASAPEAARSAALARLEPLVADVEEATGRAVVDGAELDALERTSAELDDTATGRPPAQPAQLPPPPPAPEPPPDRPGPT